MKTADLRGVVHIGDCLEWLRSLPDCSVDSVVTDPPYGLGKEPDPREVLTAWLSGEEFRPGGLVVDPFAGSGSTGVGAVREGFRFRGCERETPFATIAHERIREASNTQAALPLGFSA